jgi:hypothetical protein
MYLFSVAHLKKIIIATYNLMDAERPLWRPTAEQLDEIDENY